MFRVNFSQHLGAQRSLLRNKENPFLKTKENPFLRTTSKRFLNIYHGRWYTAHVGYRPFNIDQEIMEKDYHYAKTYKRSLVPKLGPPKTKRKVAIQNSKALHLWARKKLAKHGIAPGNLNEVNKLGDDVLRHSMGFKDFTKEQMRRLLYEVDNQQLQKDPAWYSNYICLDWEQAAVDDANSDVQNWSAGVLPNKELHELWGSVEPILPSPADIVDWQREAPFSSDAEEYYNFHLFQEWQRAQRRAEVGLTIELEHNENRMKLQEFHDHDAAELKRLLLGPKPGDEMSTLRNANKHLNEFKLRPYPITQAQAEKALKDMVEVSNLAEFEDKKYIDPDLKKPKIQKHLWIQNPENYEEPKEVKTTKNLAMELAEKDYKERLETERKKGPILERYAERDERWEKEKEFEEEKKKKGLNPFIFNDADYLEWAKKDKEEKELKKKQNNFLKLKKNIKILSVEEQEAEKNKISPISTQGIKQRISNILLQIDEIEKNQHELTQEELQGLNKKMELVAKLTGYTEEEVKQNLDTYEGRAAIDKALEEVQVKEDNGSDSDDRRPLTPKQIAKYERLARQYEEELRRARSEESEDESEILNDISKRKTRRYNQEGRMISEQGEKEDEHQDDKLNMKEEEENDREEEENEREDLEVESEENEELGEEGQGEEGDNNQQLNMKEENDREGEEEVEEDLEVESKENEEVAEEEQQQLQPQGEQQQQQLQEGEDNQQPQPQQLQGEGKGAEEQQQLQGEEGEEEEETEESSEPPEELDLDEYLDKPTPEEEKLGDYQSDTDNPDEFNKLDLYQRTKLAEKGYHRLKSKEELKKTDLSDLTNQDTEEINDVSHRYHVQEEKFLHDKEKLGLQNLEQKQIMEKAKEKLLELQRNLRILETDKKLNLDSMEHTFELINKSKGIIPDEEIDKWNAPPERDAAEEEVDENEQVEEGEETPVERRAKQIQFLLDMMRISEEWDEDYWRRGSPPVHIELEDDEDSDDEEEGEQMSKFQKDVFNFTMSNPKRYGFYPNYKERDHILEDGLYRHDPEYVAGDDELDTIVMKYHKDSPKSQKDIFRPLSSPRIFSDVAAQRMFQMHLKDPVRFSPRKLSRMFNLDLYRCIGVLKIMAQKHIEEQMENLPPEIKLQQLERKFKILKDAKEAIEKWNHHPETRPKPPYKMEEMDFFALPPQADDFGSLKRLRDLSDNEQEPKENKENNDNDNSNDENHGEDTPKSSSSSSSSSSPSSSSSNDHNMSASIKTPLPLDPAQTNLIQYADDVLKHKIPGKQKQQDVILPPLKPHQQLKELTPSEKHALSPLQDSDTESENLRFIQNLREEAQEEREKEIDKEQETAESYVKKKETEFKTKIEELKEAKKKQDEIKKQNPFKKAEEIFSFFEKKRIEEKEKQEIERRAKEHVELDTTPPPLFTDEELGTDSEKDMTAPDLELEILEKPPVVGKQPSDEDVEKPVLLPQVFGMNIDKESEKEHVESDSEDFEDELPGSPLEDLHSIVRAPEEDIVYDARRRYEEQMKTYLVGDMNVPDPIHTAMPTVAIIDDMKAFERDLEVEDRKNRFLNLNEKLEKLEEKTFSFAGPIGVPTNKKQIHKAPPILSDKLKRRGGFNWILVDISDKKNCNYEIAVRDNQGVLRGPNIKEYTFIKRREKGKGKFVYRTYRRHDVPYTRNA